MFFVISRLFGINMQKIKKKGPARREKEGTGNKKDMQRNNKLQRTNHQRNKEKESERVRCIYNNNNVMCVACLCVDGGNNVNVKKKKKKEKGKESYKG